MPEVPRLAYPFRLVGGHVAVVEQDSPEEVSQCVRIILATDIGSRTELPDFGAPPVLFARQPVDTDALHAAITTWDDRWPTVVAQTDDPDALIARVTVTLTGQADQDG